MNEIEVVKNSLVHSVVNPYQDQYDAMFSGTSFLPRLQLMTTASDKVKEGLFPMNHYALITGKDDFSDMGKEVDVFVCTWRPRAIDASDKNNIRVSSVGDSKLFLEIKEMQDTTKNSGCMYGPEFLVWVPSRELYATVLFGSKSARNEAPRMGARITKAATLKSVLIDNGEFKWQAMKVTPCTTPFDMPTQEQFDMIVVDFLNPKEITGPEKVEVEQPTRTR